MGWRILAILVIGMPYVMLTAMGTIFQFMETHHHKMFDWPVMSLAFVLVAIGSWLLTYALFGMEARSREEADRKRTQTTPVRPETKGNVVNMRDFRR